MKTRITILITLCCLLSASWSIGQNVFINNVVITKYQNNLYVYFLLEGPFSPEMEEAIKSGGKRCCFYDEMDGAGIWIKKAGFPRIKYGTGLSSPE